MKRVFVFCFFIIFLFFFQKLILAQCQKEDSPASQIIQKLSEWLRNLVIAWTILLFVFVSYKFITSEGKVGELMHVKQIIVASLLGAAIALSASEIIKTITGCE